MSTNESEPPSKTYVLALEARIKTLETRGQVLEQLLRDASINVPSPESDGIDLSVFLEAGQRSSAEPDEPDESLPEDSGASVAALLDISKLRLDVAPSKPDPSQPSSASYTYFGPQSGRFLSGTDTLPGGDPISTPISGHGSRCVRPERARAVEHVLDVAACAFPIVHAESFLSAYDVGDFNCELVTPMLLDMIFVIGSYFGPGKEGGDGANGERFLVRAETKIIEDQQSSGGDCPGALHHGRFPDGTCQDTCCWTLNGMAVALSTRLGLHIDTATLVESGAMPRNVQDARDLTFWAVFTLDRIFSTNMGLHPLHTKNNGHTSVDTNDEIPDAVWLTLISFMDMVETMFAEVYAFDAPKRTAAFVDDFPRPLRSASAMRGTEPCLVFYTCQCAGVLVHHTLVRPFVGARRYVPAPGSTLPLSAADIAAERRSRSLAFAHCRTAALRTMDLLRHLPPRSPCFTTPFFIFTASTVLLLSPPLEKDGMWVESATDAKQRIWGLARRWQITSLNGHDGPMSGGWQHITPQSHANEQVDQKPTHSRSASTSNHNPNPYQPQHQQLPPVLFQEYDQKPQSHQSIRVALLDSMPEPSVTIPWEGPVEPALWMMNGNAGSSYQASWDFLLSNPASVQADTHRVLTPAEAEALMQELRGGNLGVGRH
ncbi:Fungal specific transcription factor domain [Ceratobasidium sp. AG-Ba]|nr:Fungal specific transcription factor domain [Ceratobasidium sp. AG-Ba]